MHTINYLSTDRQRRLAVKANTIKQERRLKNFCFAYHITLRVACTMQETDKAMGLVS